jgi:curved DNA-binding protein CbpA
MKNHYDVLGLRIDAEDIVIRAAYKSLAQKYHPDKWVGDPALANQKMIEINNSYAILSDPIKKKLYDNQLKDGFKKDAFKAKSATPEDQRKYTTPTPPPSTGDDGLNKNSFLTYFFIGLLVLWVGNTLYESGLFNSSSSSRTGVNDGSLSTVPILTNSQRDQSTTLIDCINGGEQPCILTKNLYAKGVLINNGTQIFVTSNTNDILTIMFQDAGGFSEIEISKNVLLEHLK